jgi:hypothetical protein
MRAQIASVVLALWLIVSPDALGFGDPARTATRIIGPLALLFAALAIRDVTRPARWANLATGVALLFVPWVLRYGAWEPILNSLVAGVLLIGFAQVHGKTRHATGGGWAALFAAHPPERRQPAQLGP